MYGHYRSSCPKVFCWKAVLKMFWKFTGKRWWWRPSLLKLLVESKFILCFRRLSRFKKSYLRFCNFSVIAAKILHFLTNPPPLSATPRPPFNQSHFFWKSKIKHTGADVRRFFFFHDAKSSLTKRKNVLWKRLTALWNQSSIQIVALY